MRRLLMMMALAAGVLLAPWAAMAQDAIDRLVNDLLKDKPMPKVAPPTMPGKAPVPAAKPRRGGASIESADAPKDCTVESDWRYWDRAEIAKGYDVAARKALDLAHRTAAMVARADARSVAPFGADLASLEKKIAAAADGADWQAIYLEARKLRRRILLAHPLLGQFNDIIVTKVGPPGYSHMCDQYLGRHSVAGPGLTVVENWRGDRPAARAMLPEGKLPPGAVHHPELSYDAKRVVFGFCPHTEEDRAKRWFYLYEAAVDGSFVRQLTGVPGRDKLQGQDGRTTVYIEDWDPVYLPDGDILFLSTRNQGFGRCHGGRYTPSYVLYRCDRDGNNIRRISWGEANEWDPSVLNDGTVVFSRWDYINRHDCLFQSLWTTHPDGTATAHYYGNNTPVPNMILEARAIPGSHKIVSTAGAHHSFTNGKLMVIDNRKGLDGFEPITDLTPEAGYPEERPWNPTNGGTMVCSWATPWALSEELHLASFSPYPLAGQGRVQRREAFGLYLLDTLGGRELIHRDPNISTFSPMPLAPRPCPPVLASALPPNAGPEGTFFVQNVYRTGRGEIPPGSAKFLRVVGINEQPTAGAASRGKAANEIVKWVIGTVPIEPDGSVAFQAPANKTLLFQALDANHMSLFSMRSQVYLQPGEKMSCVGCHEPDATNASPRATHAFAVRKITPPPGPAQNDGFSFAKTVQPVLDRYCIGCHGLEDGAAPAGAVGAAKGKAIADLRGKAAAGAASPGRTGLNLMGDVRGGFSSGFEGLTRGGLVRIAPRNGETHYSKPMDGLDYGARQGKLAGLLLAGHPDAAGKQRVKLDSASIQRLMQWMDLNAQYTGDYTGRDRPEKAAHKPEAETALRDHVRTSCDKCHAGMSAQPYWALVNKANAGESRVLLAPLAEQAGGWGQCQAQWKSADEKAWRDLRAKVLAAAAVAAAEPAAVARK